MKAKVITNDLSFLLGFRLGGIDGLILENEEEISYNFKNFTKEKDLALIIFSIKNDTVNTSINPKLKYSSRSTNCFST